MELLILLIQRHGELVSRDEIARHIWGGDVFLDVDHNINTAIRKIRQALHDDPEKPRFLETISAKVTALLPPSCPMRKRNSIGRKCP
jgi:DNA-binding winged helix-turn-helix (wHTH) protein